MGLSRRSLLAALGLAVPAIALTAAEADAASDTANASHRRTPKKSGQAKRNSQSKHANSRRRRKPHSAA